MLHLRIVAPHERCSQMLELLEGMDSVCNVIVIEGAARKPPGDVVLCDVAREDASLLFADLRELQIDHYGSIAVEEIDIELSDAATRATRAAPGTFGDAVVWEEIENTTRESAELSASYLVFIMLAGLIAMSGILLDSPILIVGAMVVSPDFGPVAGFCVATVERRLGLALRSARALAIGFPLAALSAFLVSLALHHTALGPDSFGAGSNSLGNVISNPGFFAFFVAFCAGAAGVLSLTTAKSSALIGVFISVTTIPAAANIGVSAAYGDWTSFGGSAAQLAINVASLLVGGTLTLAVERVLYARRRHRHEQDAARGGAGLPVAQRTPRSLRVP